MIHVTRKRFDELVEEALELLPAQFREKLGNITVEVMTTPSAKMMRGLGGGNRLNLLGLYDGVPLTEKSVEFIVEWPERIYLFQYNIERACRTEDELVEQIRITVLHEIAHHFGFSDDELDEMGYD